MAECNYSKLFFRILYMQYHNKLPFTEVLIDGSTILYLDKVKSVILLIPWALVVGQRIFYVIVDDKDQLNLGLASEYNNGTILPAGYTVLSSDEIEAILRRLIRSFTTDGLRNYPLLFLRAVNNDILENTCDTFFQPVNLLTKDFVDQTDVALPICCFF